MVLIDDNIIDFFLQTYVVEKTTRPPRNGPKFPCLLRTPSLRHVKVTIWRGPAESCKKIAPASRQQVNFYIILNINIGYKKAAWNFSIKLATLRTWKEAYFNDYVCCPHQRCTNKTAFFNKAGSKQHLFILQDSACPLEIVTFPWHNEGLRRRQEIPCRRSLARVKMPFETRHFVETNVLLRKDTIYFYDIFFYVLDQIENGVILGFNETTSVPRKIINI